MGNTIRVNKEDTVNLDNLREYWIETYTVVRTDQSHDNDWSIPAMTHSSCPPCHGDDEEGVWVGRYATKHITKGKKGDNVWRVFMTKTSREGHSCGWRRVTTFWPTRITDLWEIDKWQQEFIKVLESLEEERVKSEKDVKGA